MEKYRKIQKVGQGSFGCAILVQQNENRKFYIMKIIDISRMDQKQREDAVNEVKFLKALIHPFIITYRESFMDKNRYMCIVMDYADGGDLYQKIKQQKKLMKPFSEELILDWFVQICFGLKFVHDKKILHRDLKTQNIFLTTQGQVKIGDFGIARVLQNTSDCANTAIGTPYYISPEICQGQSYNQKSDIWSLGCILYELITLKHAFDASNKDHIRIKIINGDYQQIPDSFSKDLQELVGEMLQQNPENRPSIRKILQKPFLQKYISVLIQRNDEFQFSDEINLKENSGGVLKSGGNILKLQNQSLVNSITSQNSNSTNSQSFKLNSSLENQSNKENYNFNQEMGNNNNSIKQLKQIKEIQSQQNPQQQQNKFQEQQFYFKNQSPRISPNLVQNNNISKEKRSLSNIRRSQNEDFGHFLNINNNNKVINHQLSHKSFQNQQNNQNQSLQYNSNKITITDNSFAQDEINNKPVNNSLNNFRERSSSNNGQYNLNEGFPLKMAKISSKSRLRGISQQAIRPNFIIQKQDSKKYLNSNKEINNSNNIANKSFDDQISKEQLELNLIQKEAYTFNGIQEDESDFLKIEAIRIFLESKLSEKLFLKVYQCFQNENGIQSTKLNQLLVLVKPKYVSLIKFLIKKENQMYANQ